MESSLENEQKSENHSALQPDENTTTSQTDENTKVIYVNNNNRRIHDEETKAILSKMNLATRSILWELEPVEIKYLFSIMRINVNGKKVMTLKGLNRQLLKEMSNQNKKHRGNEK